LHGILSQPKPGVEYRVAQLVQNKQKGKNNDSKD